MGYPVGDQRAVADMLDGGLVSQAVNDVLGTLGGQGIGVYGDGSDGVRTFDGTTTILGMVPSANAYTLVRDTFLQSSIINTGVSIITNGYKIFCSGVLTNNGTIQWNGAAGTLGGAGAAALGNTLGSIYAVSANGGSGGAGATGAGGAGGIATTRGMGGSGGNGGAGGTGAAGAGGVTAANNASSSIRYAPASVFGQPISGAPAFLGMGGGAGGGGGGGDGVNSGGGGGAGGGNMVVNVRFIAGTGAIQARGGAGGAGAATGNTGGGGGGGGGLVLVTSASVVIGSPNSIAGQTIDANGGAPGGKNGTGAVGVVGSNGTVILVPN